MATNNALNNTCTSNFSVTRSDAASVVTLSTQNLGNNTAMISSTANSGGNGAGFFSSGQYDTTKYWNFGMNPTNAATNAGGFNISYNTVGQADPSGGTPTLRIGTTGIVTVSANDLVVSRNSVGTSVVTQIYNTDNTNGASAAALIIQSGGASGGDAAVIMGYSAANDWAIGQDISDSEKFKISRGNALGTNDVLTATTTGNITVPSGDLTVTRGSGLPEIVVNNTSTTDFARFRAVAASPKTGFFSSGIDTPLYWNFGMASTLSNAYCLNTSAGPVAPEGGTIVWKATTAGEITMPLQPAFFAYLATTATDKTGNGASYQLGTDALTEVYDQGNNFNTNGTFTAPVTGIYDLRAQVGFQGCTIATNFQINIVVSGTSARTYQNTFTRAASSNNQYVYISTLAKMTASDTAVVTVLSTGEAGNTDDITGAADSVTYFCGTLAC